MSILIVKVVRVVMCATIEEKNKKDKKMLCKSEQRPPKTDQIQSVSPFSRLKLRRDVIS